MTKQFYDLHFEEIVKIKDQRIEEIVAMEKELQRLRESVEEMEEVIFELNEMYGHDDQNNQV